MRYAVPILVIIAILAGGAYTVWRTHNGSTDFDTYYYAAKRILDGRPLYEEIKGLSPYIYPPFFACMLTPLALLDMRLASFLWYLLNIALIFLSFGLISMLVFGGGRMADNLGRVRVIPRAIALGVTGAVFLDNLSLLQVNIFVFAAVLAGLYLFSKKRVFASAAAFAFAISVKVIPVVFILYFLVKRQFRLVLLTALLVFLFSAVIPVLALGPESAAGAFGWWRSETFEKTAGNNTNFQMMDNMFNPENQSVTAILSRWLVANDSNVIYWKKVSHNYPAFIRNVNLGLTAQAAVSIAKALTLLLIIITLAACAFPARTRGPGHAACEYALVMLLALLTTPILKTQYFTFALPAVFLTLNLERKKSLYVLVIFLALYASQAVELFEIIGLGGAAIVFLWIVFLVRRIRLN